MKNIRDLQGAVYLKQVIDCLEDNGFESNDIVRCNHLLYLSHVFAIVLYSNTEEEKEDNKGLCMLEFQSYPAGPMLKGFVDFAMQDNIAEINCLLNEFTYDELKFPIEIVVSRLGGLSFYELGLATCGNKQLTPWFWQSKEYGIIDKEHIMSYYTEPRLLSYIQ